MTEEEAVIAAEEYECLQEQLYEARLDEAYGRDVYTKAEAQRQIEYLMELMSKVKTIIE